MRVRTEVAEPEGGWGALRPADVASVAAVLVGTVRVALIYVPWVSDGLRLACGGDRASKHEG